MCSQSPPMAQVRHLHSMCATISRNSSRSKIPWSIYLFGSQLSQQERWRGRYPRRDYLRGLYLQRDLSTSKQAQSQPLLRLPARLASSLQKGQQGKGDNISTVCVCKDIFRPWRRCRHSLRPWASLFRSSGRLATEETREWTYATIMLPWAGTLLFWGWERYHLLVVGTREWALSSSGCKLAR